jgi:hypothetical protein
MEARNMEAIAPTPISATNVQGPIGWGCSIRYARKPVPGTPRSASNIMTATKTAIAAYTKDGSLTKNGGPKTLSAGR